MLLAEGVTSLHLVLIGLTMLVIAFLVRRSVTLHKRTSGRDVAGEVRRDMLAAEKTVASRIAKLEVRLHDYDRDVNGRIQTKLAMLDRLIEEADQEIDKLSGLLNSDQLRSAIRSHASGKTIDRLGSDSDTSIQPLSAEQRRMIVHVWNAGYAAEEIATLISRSADEIRQVLDDEIDSSQADAA